MAGGIADNGADSGADNATAGKPDDGTRGKRVRVVALCSLATFLDGYDIQALGMAVPGMARDFAVEPAAFAAALSASLIGMAFGAMTLGPMGDRFGRRPMLIAWLVVIGLATLGTTLSTAPLHVVVWRFIAGLGMGGLVPVAITMVAEYAPPKRRTALVTMMVACTALGSFAGGILAPALEAQFGWRGIFGAGGLMPLVAAGMMWIALPDSPFAAALLKSGVKPSVAGLFRDGLRARTNLLWAIFGLNLFVNYSLISWLPTLLETAGWVRGDAQRATGLLALGGLTGGLLLAWLADRGHAVKALATSYIGAAAVLSLFMAGPESQGLWRILLILIGGAAIGAQMALGSLAAVYYPPELRATGLGWSSGIGRIGAMLGPLGLGLLLSRGMAPSLILGLLMIPMIACALCVGWLGLALRKSGDVA